MRDIGATPLSTALLAKQSNLHKLLTRANVVACGIGYKITSCGLTDEIAVIVSVRHKLPTAQLAESDMVPREIDGVKTDVVETGALRALLGPRDCWRPVVPPGVSLGHVDVTAGTFGCLVRRGNELFILSNNHVLANANQGKIGDPILQPGRYDGGTAQDQIATLAEYVPLDFGGGAATCTLAGTVEKGLNALASLVGSSHRLMAYQQTPGNNRMDAALARPIDPAAVKPDILGIGRPVGVRQASLGTAVKKSGRTTGYTEGLITQIDVTSQVVYGAALATFQGQLMADAMSAGGDSGSAILDRENYVVGLLFAGSDSTTLVNPIQPILQTLNVEIVT